MITWWPPLVRKVTTDEKTWLGWRRYDARAKDYSGRDIEHFFRSEFLTRLLDSSSPGVGPSGRYEKERRTHVEEETGE